MVWPIMPLFAGGHATLQLFKPVQHDVDLRRRRLRQLQRGFRKARGVDRPGWPWAPAKLEFAEYNAINYWHGKFLVSVAYRDLPNWLPASPASPSNLRPSNVRRARPVASRELLPHAGRVERRGKTRD